MDTQQLAEQTALQLATSNILDTKDIIRKALDQVREQTIKESENWIKDLAEIEGTDYLLLDQNPMRQEIQLDVDTMLADYRKAMEE